jgi:hypothetical protein
MFDDRKKLVQYISCRDQTLEDLRDKVKVISEYIVENLICEDDAAREIILSIKGLLESLEGSMNFIKGTVTSPTGRLFVQKVLFVNTRIQKYLSSLVRSGEDYAFVTWSFTKYCEILSRYASRIQTV